MPFQLNTGIYSNGGGGDGGGGRQASPFGQLGALMELQMRRENLESQKDQRALINEQRQQAIDKITRAQAGQEGLRKLLETDPNASAAQMAQYIPLKDAEDIVKTRLDNEGTRLKVIAGALGSVLAYPDEAQQKVAFEREQARLEQLKYITPDQKVEYSPGAVAQAQQRALSALEQLQTSTTKQQANTATAAETRLTADATAERPKKEAEALEAARRNLVPLLQNAATPAAYQALYDKADPRIQGSLPTVEEWTKNRTRANTKLGAFGLTPEQAAQDDDRNKQREMAERHHRQTEDRLTKQYGPGALTSTMYQTANKRRADDEQRLAERVADARRQGKPMTEAEIKDEQFRIGQAFDSEMRLPPSLSLADERKKNLLDTLEKDFIDRNKPIQVEGQPDEKPRNPMSKEELEAGKKAIQYRYRSWFGLGPEPVAGTGQLGALADTNPPQVTPPAATPQVVPPPGPQAQAAPQQGPGPRAPLAPAAAAQAKAIEAQIAEQIALQRQGKTIDIQNLMELRTRLRTLTGR